MDKLKSGCQPDVVDTNSSYVLEKRIKQISKMCCRLWKPSYVGLWLLQYSAVLQELGISIHVALWG